MKFGDLKGNCTTTVFTPRSSLLSLPCMRLCLSAPLPRSRRVINKSFHDKSNSLSQVEGKRHTTVAHQVIPSDPRSYRPLFVFGVAPKGTETRRERISLGIEPTAQGDVNEGRHEGCDGSGSGLPVPLAVCVPGQWLPHPCKDEQDHPEPPAALCEYCQYR